MRCETNFSSRRLSCAFARFARPEKSSFKMRVLFERNIVFYINLPLQCQQVSPKVLLLFIDLKIVTVISKHNVDN